MTVDVVSRLKPVRFSAWLWVLSIYSWFYSFLSGYILFDWNTKF